jgi:hypothetical protein
MLRAMKAISRLTHASRRGASGYAIDRANVRQRKTAQPMRFELTEQTRESLDTYLPSSGASRGRFCFWVEAAQIDL